MQTVENLLVTTVQSYCTFETAKMKMFMLVSFLLVGLVYSTPVDTSEPSEKETLVFEAIQNYLNKKIACENDSVKNATEMIDEIGDCLKSYSPRSPEDFETFGKPGASYDICENPEKVERIAECLIPAFHVLRACSDDEEKYLPEFILNTIKNVIINFACANEGKNIEKIIQKSATRCFASMQGDPQKSPLTVCANEIDSILVMLDDGVMTKKELCDLLEAERVCYINYVEKQCPNDSNVKEVFGEFIDAIASSC